MSYHLMTPRFPLGRIVATPAVMGLALNLAYYIRRHHCGDWGDIERCDGRENEEALANGGRILSAFRLPDGEWIYILTEADRSSTCIMLPAEY